MDFTNIWQQEGYYDQVIHFWNQLCVLPENVKPEDRAKELVNMARDGDRVIGVTTAARVRVNQLNDNFLFSFRILVHPDYRRPGLSSKLTVLTRDFLEQLFEKKKTDCIGMMVITDKTEFVTIRNEAVWRASKLTYIGTLTNGQHMRVYYFKGARI